MNIYGTSSIFPGCGVDGQNVAPQPGVSTLRVDPATAKLQLSNNGGAYLDVSAGNSGKSVIAGTNINVTTDISGNWVTSTVMNPTFTALTTTSGLVNNVDISALSGTVSGYLNQAVKTTSIPTFGGLSLTGPLTTSSTLDGVLLGAFKTDYDSKVDQSVKILASPTFNTLTTTNGLVNGVSLSGMAAVINADLDQAVKTSSSPTFVGLSLSAPLVTSSSLDGVDLSVFKADYDSKVNQAVLSSSTPTFTAVDIDSIGSLLQSGTEMQLVGNTSSTGFRMTYGPTLNRRSILINETDGLWAHRLSSSSLVATSVATDSVYSASSLSLGVGVSEKLRLSSSSISAYDDFFIRPDIDSTATFKISSAASRETFTVDSADGGLYINGPAMSSTEFLATKILAANQSAGTLTTTLLGVNTTSMNCFKTSFGYVASGAAGNYLSFSGYGAYQPAMTLDTNGNTFYTSQADLLTSTMKYQYAQTSNLYYRLVSSRLNSGNGPSGRNRLEWYGINGQYIAGSTPAAFTKTYGFTFQQQPSVGAGYYDILDIDWDGVSINSTTPLRSNYYEPATDGAMVFRGRSAGPGSSTDYTFYNNNISSVGLKVSCTGSGVLVRGASSSNNVSLQSYISGTATNTLTLGSAGMTANYLIIGTGGVATAGGLRNNAAYPQWNDGTSWLSFQIQGANVTTNTVTCLPASAMYLRGDGLTSTQAQSYYLSNCSLDSTALHIRPDGATDDISIKSLTATGSITHQAYISGTPTAVATVNTSGLSIDYIRIGSNGQAAVGGLRRNGTLMQFHDGTAWTTLATPQTYVGRFSVTRIAGSTFGVIVDSSLSGAVPGWSVGTIVGTDTSVPITWIDQSNYRVQITVEQNTPAVLWPNVVPSWPSGVFTMNYYSYSSTANIQIGSILPADGYIFSVILSITKVA